MTSAITFSCNSTKSKEMPDWNYLLTRGKRDLKRSIESFKEKSDYELSAYLAQQALEKHVKASLLKNNIIVDPEKLKHIQVIGILNMLKEDMIRVRREHTKSYDLLKLIEHYLTLIDDIVSFYKKIRDDPEVKKSIWKYSLNMASNEDVERLFPEVLRKVSKDGNRIKNSSNKFDQNVTVPNIDKIESVLGIPREQLLNFISKFSDMGELLSKLDLKLIMENKSFTMEGLNLLQNIERVQALGKIKPSTTELKSQSLFIINEIFEFSLIIIKLFPHEEISRYPTMIDGVISTDVYEQRKDDLWNLIVETKLTCEEVERRNSLKLC